MCGLSGRDLLFIDVHRNEEISLGQNIVRGIPFRHRINALCPGYGLRIIKEARRRYRVSLQFTEKEC
jgi:hypothetical protein